MASPTATVGPVSDEVADDITITTLSTPDEMADAGRVLQQIWGANRPMVGAELLLAIEHAGGYVAGAYDGDHLLGASFGFLARHLDEPALHSHITGILPGVRHSGLGRAMKYHQKSWAAERDIAWITWTFDPLVRANAWFNLEVLGAQIAEYLVNFYGPMTDAVNAGDESDRLVAAWAVDERQQPDPPGPPIHIPTPDDIVALRRTDPIAAERWRHDVRERMVAAMAAGAVVTGMTRSGDYIMKGQN